MLRGHSNGMQINVKELKALRDVNQRLEKLLAERDLEVDVMKEINAKDATLRTQV